MESTSTGSVAKREENLTADEGSLGRMENPCCLEDKKDGSNSPRARIALDSLPAAELPVPGYDPNQYVVVNEEPFGTQRSDVTTQASPNNSSTETTSPMRNPEETYDLKTNQLPACSGAEYFIPETAPSTELDDNSRATSTSTLASSAFSFVSSQRNITSAPHSPQGQLGTSRPSPTPTPNVVIPPGKPPRPTSVPILTSNSSSTRRRRDGPEYPRYPDQSFAALQSQHYPSYQPQSLRTRSSHASQNSSFSSIPSRGSRDHITMVTGAKTVGNTPAQSPGLFSPVYPASRNIVDESEDSQTSTPLMHPAHMQTPKETHNLSKDVDPETGHKTLNEYELLYKLGEGQHGTVKLGRNLDTGEYVAVKIVRRNARKRRLRRTEDPAEMIKREIAILKKARHPHVVSLLEVIDDVQYGKVYLILEFVQLGEIVWRKMTDKNIATFEMNRIKRELDGANDPDFESAEVERFNSTVVLRRSQKAQAFSERKAVEGHVAEDSNFEKQTAAASESQFWSLEHGADSEDDAARHSSFAGGLGLGMSSSVAHDESSLGTSFYDPLSNESPETPKPMPVHERDMRASTSRPTSSPGSSANLPEKIFGPYTAEEQTTDSLLQTFLNHSLTEEQVNEEDWTAEEKLYMHVPCLTISQALDVFRDTVLGLEFLHYQGIIHRDIKPANLLWTSDHRIKISDFGVSYLGKLIKTQAGEDELSSPDAADVQEALELAKTVGTPAFYAPELCNPDIFSTDNKNARPLITGQIDVWALGVTLYGMIFGRLPFFDPNEFIMYEKIAKDPLFIPRRRLKGVEYKPKPHMNSNKRFDDIIEYEDVDDELCDLLARLLDKDPSKRITIKEVKHHPWVLRGIQNQPAWIDETDPNLQSEGRKIEISNEDMQEAVVPVTFVDRLKSSLGSIRRFGTSIHHRGRNRNRTGSEAGEVQGTDAIHPSITTSVGPESRRSSLRGDEQIFTALKASRENSEHPLSQSVTASPEIKADEDYFDNTDAPTLTNNRSSPHTKRPSLSMRSVSSISNAESMKTIRAVVPPLIKENSSSPTESFSTNTAIVDAPGPLSLGGIFGGSRRFINKIRSRERGRTHGNGPSAESSRSSSISNEAIAPNFEDTRSSPSLAFSTAVAAGRLNPPPALRDENSISVPPSFNQLPLSHDPSAEAFQEEVDMSNHRRTLEHLEELDVPQTKYQANRFAAGPSCPPSPDDGTFPLIQGPIAKARADEAPAFGISSSSDQLASTNISESFSHPSIPSVVSGASSLSGTIEPPSYPSGKTTSPSTIVPKRDEALADRLDDDPAELTPKEDDVQPALEEDEAGYNGEEEMDSDSDSGVLEMGGQRKKPGSSAPP